MGANACTRMVLKQSNELLAAAYQSHVVNFIAGAAQTLGVAELDANPPTYVTGINPADETPTEKDIKHVFDVDIGYTATVMVDYSVGYTTVAAFSSATEDAPGPWEGSPFMLEILDWIVDEAATAANNGVPVYVVRPSTIADPNPTFKLLPQSGVHNVNATPLQLVANGRIELGPYTPAADATYAIRKSVSLVWVYNTGDWNQANPASAADLGGYTIPIVANPFPTTLVTAPTNSRISFDTRYG